MMDGLIMFKAQIHIEPKNIFECQITRNVFLGIISFQIWKNIQRPYSNSV